MAHEGKRRGANAKAAPVVVSEVDQQLEDFKVQSKKQGETLVKELFPKKVIELNSLLEPPTKKRKSDSVDDGTNNVDGSHVILLPDGSVPVNSKIVEIINIIKPLAIELIEHANVIKMWITYMIPKIEDGNNFGVSIQEDTMAEARQIESEAATYLDQISRYYLTRGKIVSKVAKYPHVDDYRQTIQELDEKEFMSLRLVVTEMRNHYASLHDLIVKNLDKIRKPRSTNTDNMY